MHPVLQNAIDNPRMPQPYGSDVEDSRYDIGAIVKASDSYIKQNSCGWSNEETDMNTRRTMVVGRAKIMSNDTLH